MTRGRILVVDDDKNILQVIRTRLQSEDFDVDVASSGPEALKQWGGNHYDVMIVDVRMPSRDGTDVARELKMLEPAVCVVIFTAWLNDDLLLQVAADRVVDKHLGVEPLLQIVRGSIPERCVFRLDDGLPQKEEVLLRRNALLALDEAGTLRKAAEIVGRDIRTLKKRLATRTDGE